MLNNDNISNLDCWTTIQKYAKHKDVKDCPYSVRKLGPYGP